MSDSLVVDARVRIAELRAEGYSAEEIARRLNGAGIPTATGLVGRWTGPQIARTEHPERWAAYMREYRQDVKVNGLRRWR